MQLKVVMKMDSLSFVFFAINESNGKRIYYYAGTKGSLWHLMGKTCYLN
jgi:hypothetical protein